MNFKYIQNVTDEVAEIRIYKRIGASFDQDGVNGSDFANEMAWLQDKCSKINVRINSGGGNVIESYAIINSILNSKVPCDTYIDGIAASAAASIAVCGRKVYMVDYGVFMIHNAVDNSNEASQAILDVFNASINKILTNRTKLTEEKINEMMTAETWMDCNQCKEMGFIDSIVSTEKKVRVKPTASIEEAYALCNEILNENKPTNKPNMKNLTAMLNLSNEATEVEIVKAIEAKDAKIVELTNTIKSFNDEKAANEQAKKDAEKAALVTKATDLVNKAKDDKKVNDDEVASLIENASVSETNYSLVENMLNKISVVKVANKVFDPANVTDVAKERADWDFDTWSKKDSAGLEKMQNENPTMFNDLIAKIPTNIKSKF